MAKAGDGSMRDSLSLLDQCIAFYMGEDLTYDKVLKVLGAVDQEIFSSMLRTVLAGDVSGAVSRLEDMVIQGRDLYQFVVDFTWYLRNLMLVKSDTDMEDVLDVSGENMEKLREEAGMIDDGALMRYIRIFSELSNQIRYSSQKRVLIEIALIKLCRPQMEQDYGSLIQRVEQMEDALSRGSFSAAGAAPAIQEKPPEQKKIPEVLQEDVEKLCRNWTKIRAGAAGALRQALAAAHPTVEKNGEMLLVYDEPQGSKSIQSSLLEDEGIMEDLQDLIEEQIGVRVPVRIKVNRSAVPGSTLYESAIEHFSRTADIDIEIEDEEDF